VKGGVKKKCAGGNSRYGGGGQSWNGKPGKRKQVPQPGETGQSIYSAGDWANKDGTMAAKVGQFKLTGSKPVLKAPMVSALDTINDESLSNLAFKFNLRRYTKAKEKQAAGGGRVQVGAGMRGGNNGGGGSRMEAMSGAGSKSMCGYSTGGGPGPGAAKAAAYEAAEAARRAKLEHGRDPNP